MTGAVARLWRQKNNLQLMRQTRELMSEQRWSPWGSRAAVEIGYEEAFLAVRSRSFRAAWRIGIEAGVWGEYETTSPEGIQE